MEVLVQRAVEACDIVYQATNTAQLFEEINRAYRQLLAQLGIDSISVNPPSILRTMQVVSDAEKAPELTGTPVKAAE